MYWSPRSNPDCLVHAGQKSITKCKPSCKRIPGWNDHVRLLRDDSIFWHRIWQQCGCPTAGWIAQIRRTTRSKYHRAVRSVKNRKLEIISQKMADSLNSNSQRDFWRESKKINNTGEPSPSNVDGGTGDADIASVFVENYRDLYNSVSFSESQMLNWNILDTKISDCCLGKMFFCTWSISGWCWGGNATNECW